VSEDEAHEALRDLCDRKLIETLVPGKFAIVKWRERDVAEEEGLIGEGGREKRARHADHRGWAREIESP
jgi:hypothetical protein